MALENTRNFWYRRYKMLDPTAYTYVSGSNKTWVVPAGHTWYALNMWFTLVNGVGPYFHRLPSVENVIELPAGTVISTAAQSGFMYYCDVASGTEPTRDPQEDYYRRLGLLSSVPIQSLRATLPVGSAANTTANASFSGTFNGIIRGVANIDVAWTITLGAAMNLHEEISDAHQQRLTSALLFPFVSTTVTGIQIQTGSTSGNGTDTSLAGAGQILYQALPAGW
ncbi:hypothetical protein [Bradyrhizobium sp. 1200_D9_N1_1]|uniref:hypothetical protein n=1 Tax=Bradyrhizobium sp. 1200_D9_N1_1 TaxID=3239013 RepID=UPI003F8AF336